MSVMSAKSSDWRPGPSVCRCCFAEGCYKDISTEYFWMGKREVYQEMLSDTFDVSISYSLSGGPNSNSRLICEPCISRLRDASDFKRQVQECERVFQQHLDPSSSGADLEALTDAKEVKLERVKLESKMSDDDDDFDAGGGFDDDDDDDLDDQPLTKLATKVPKKESIDLMDLLDNAKPEKRKAVAKPKASPAKKIKLTKKTDTPKPSVSKPAPKPAAKKKGDVDAKQEAPRIRLVRKQPKPPVKIIWTRVRKHEEGKGNAASILANSNAVVFKWKRGKLMCAYCKFTCLDMNELRQHSAGHDKLSLFNKSSALNITYPLRIDITELSCSICNQVVGSIDNLKVHLKEAHAKKTGSYCDMGDGVVPFILTKGDFGCANCDQTFCNFMSLSLHMNEHYKYFVCRTCGKTFSNYYKLKRHSLCHETESSKCPQCDVVLPNHNAKQRHMISVHRPKERYTCPMCSSRFGSYHARLKHLEREHGQKSEYPCSMCPSVFSTGTSRNAHVRGVHKKTVKSKKDSN